jgi:hypothetical protein
MFDFDEHVLHAISPHVYPKPKEIDPEDLRKKSNIEIMNQNLTHSIEKRKSKLDVTIYFKI